MDSAGCSPKSRRSAKRGELIMESSGYLVEVKHLWKVFGDNDSPFNMEDYLSGSGDTEAAEGQVVAVRDVSFRLPEGEVYVVMGLSGSGKSTLIRCLLRLIEPDYGQILVEGQDVTAMDRQHLTEFRRTRVAMVFQHYGLLPHRTVLENAAFGLKLRGMERRERETRALFAAYYLCLFPFPAFKGHNLQPRSRRPAVLQ